jgi:ABC-type proline/glycine betaine transport system permease subunit
MAQVRDSQQHEHAGRRAPASSADPVPASRFARPLVRYGALFIVWTVVGIYFFTQDLSRTLIWPDPVPWWQYLTSWLLGVWLLALTTPVVLWLGRRWPIERPGWWLRAAQHAGYSVVFSVLHVVAVSALAPRVGFVGGLRSVSFAQTFPILAVVSLHPNVISYWAIVGIQHGVRYYWRFQERQKQALRLELHASELESQLVHARLGALKMQLQPHFLFNTMNAIMVLVRQQRGAEAEETIARLSDLLRFVLDDAQAQEVPLRRELEYLGLYLSIEQLRFADLRVEIDADPAVLDAAVPHMGLQPIVENAVRHGTSVSETGGTIRLTANRVADNLVLEVTDDGPGLFRSAPARSLPVEPAGPVAASADRAPSEPAGRARRGIGLDNTRARLRQLYGDRASLSIANGKRSGAVVTMVLPYRTAPVGDAA